MKIPLYFTGFQMKLAVYRNQSKNDSGFPRVLWSMDPFIQTKSPETEEDRMLNSSIRLYGAKKKQKTKKKKEKTEAGAVAPRQQPSDL